MNGKETHLLPIQPNKPYIDQPVHFFIFILCSENSIVFKFLLKSQKDILSLYNKVFGFYGVAVPYV